MNKRYDQTDEERDQSSKLERERAQKQKSRQQGDDPRRSDQQQSGQEPRRQTDEDRRGSGENIQPYEETTIDEP